MSLRLDKDNHPDVNKLFKQLNDGIPTHYQHFFIVAGDSGYLPSYNDESPYYSLDEASESLKEYVEHIPNEDGNRETKVEEETTETNTAEAQGAGGGDGGTNQEENLQNKERKIPDPVKQKGADDGEQETSNTNSKPSNEEEEGKIAIQYEYEFIDSKYFGTPFELNEMISMEGVK